MSAQSFSRSQFRPGGLLPVFGNLPLPDYGRVARQSPGTHTGLTRSSEVALKAVSRLLARWTIRIARRPLHRPASLAAWGCNMLRPLQKATLLTR